MSKPLHFPVPGLKNDDSKMLAEEMAALADFRKDIGGVLELIGKHKEWEKSASDQDKKTGKGQPSQEDPYSIGLALSGGGIRSATVSLGIMQRLAGKKGILKHVDYLSTVSGGGFIGSALTWWLRGEHGASEKFDTGENFPFGTTDPAEPENGAAPHPPLHYLRTQGKYLLPSRKITIWSGAAILIRSIFLNLVVWLPVTAFVMLLLLWLGQWSGLQGLPWMVRMVAPDALTEVADVVGSRGQLELNQTVPPAFLFFIIAALGIFLLFVLASLGNSLLSWTSHPPPPDKEYDSPEGRRWQTWPLVGLICLFTLLYGAATIWWLHPVIEPMFADKRSLPLGVDMTAGLRGRIGLALGMIGFLLAATFLALCVTGREGRPQWISRGDWLRISLVFGALFFLLVGAIIAAEFGPARLSLLLQFWFAAGGIVTAYYLANTLTRYYMRHERFDERETPEKKPGLTVDYFYYASRRLFEKNFGSLLFMSLMLIVLGSLPLVHSYIGYKIGGTGTAIGLLLAAGGNLWGRLSGHGRWTSFFVIVGAIIICYSVLLVGFSLASDSMGDGVSPTKRALLAAAIFFAVIFGWFVNTNYIGLHRFYRDRLMEAYMPDFDKSWKRGGKDPVYRNAPSRRANDFDISQAWPPKPGKKKDKDGNDTDEDDEFKLETSGPYHLVNTNLVIPNSPTRHYRLRGGDNFVLSPLHFGASAVGWRPPKKTDFGALSLSSAMAISGAAANPRGGAGGRGLTRNSFVSLVMSLLNVRLGYWVPNPERPVRWKLPKRPNHFWPGGVYALANAIGYGYREDSFWLELADGGHFENLAVYELVRRRCGLIIVCDGGQDNASSYADLVTAIQRIGEDFGARIHFDVEVKAKSEAKRAQWVVSSPAQLIAKSTNSDYPKGAEFAERGYFVARIDYGKRGGGGWPRQGILIYLKSTLIKDLDARAKGYAGAHPKFPNESTGDQFFDEEQFEAYREVGYRICDQMLEGLDLAGLFAKDKRPDLDELRRNRQFRCP